MVEKGVELVAEEMVAEKEGLVVEAAEGAAEGESVGHRRVALRCSGSTRMRVTSALFEHDPGFVAVTRKVLPARTHWSCLHTASPSTCWQY